MAHENGKKQSVEVQPRATRRTFSAEYKRRCADESEPLAGVKSILGQQLAFRGPLRSIQLQQGDGENVHQCVITSTLHTRVS